MDWAVVPPTFLQRINQTLYRFSPFNYQWAFLMLSDRLYNWNPYNFFRRLLRWLLSVLEEFVKPLKHLVLRVVE
jgi:hypothetical protein